MNRKMVIASSAIHEKSAIHSLTEFNVTLARKRIREIREKGGPSISLTAYLVHCLARSLTDQPEYFHGQTQGNNGCHCGGHVQQNKHLARTPWNAQDFTPPTVKEIPW
jgi:hypothetical protein